ncbi:MAG: peptidoglycan-binding domain-containing protein [Paracoccus sp. (in: a-proteobacteria)]|nr:peptidoglycan-binding domain-containing protein [Paracoccus sp. (in: a-proteobacteria)]
MMKRIALMMLTAALPATALAEDVFIRVEAKRGADAASVAAAEWQQRVGDLGAVVFPLGSGWTAIGLGPLPRDEAEARMQALKSARVIPADSLLAAASGLNVTPVAAGAAGAQDDGVDQTGAASITEDPAVAPPAPGASTAGLAPVPAEPAEPEAMPEPEPPAPERFLRLEAFQDRARAEAALSARRATIPEAGLWQLENGWYAIAAGPMPENVAKDWLAALEAGGAIPDDSVSVSQDDLGTPLDAGEAPGWPAAPETAGEMPPTAEIQEILKWAGFYNGTVDGQTGPMTRAATASAIAAQRASLDPAAAIADLERAREAWHATMRLEVLNDDHTGLALSAPMARLAHERVERSLSIYGPKDESGAALILFAQPGGQQEMLDMAGLVTALGWVPAPERHIERGRASLSGRNATHIGRAEARIRDGLVEGWVLIWPVADEINAPRIAAEIGESFTRARPPASARAPEDEASPPDSAPANAAPAGADQAATPE